MIQIEQYKEILSIFTILTKENKWGALLLLSGCILILSLGIKSIIFPDTNEYTINTYPSPRTILNPIASDSVVSTSQFHEHFISSNQTKGLGQPNFEFSYYIENQLSEQTIESSEQLENLFLNTNHTKLNFGITQSPIWLRIAPKFETENKPNLDLNIALYETIKIFKSNSGTNPKSTTLNLLFSHHNAGFKPPSLSSLIDFQTNEIYYLKIESKHPISIDIKQTPDNTQSYSTVITGLFGSLISTTLLCFAATFWQPRIFPMSLAIIKSAFVTLFYTLSGVELFSNSEFIKPSWPLLLSTIIIFLSILTHALNNTPDKITFMKTTLSLPVFFTTVACFFILGTTQQPIVLIAAVIMLASAVLGYNLYYPYSSSQKNNHTPSAQRPNLLNLGVSCSFMMLLLTGLCLLIWALSGELLIFNKISTLLIFPALAAYSLFGFTLTKAILSIQTDPFITPAHKPEPSADINQKVLGKLKEELIFPLNRMLQTYDYMRKPETQAPPKQYLDAITESTQNMLDKVSEYSELATLMKEDVQWENQPVDLHAWTIKNLGQWESYIAQNKRQLILSFKPSSTHLINSDPEKISQIFSAFFTTTIDYSTQGNISVRIETIELNEHQVELKITFKDNGSSVPYDVVDLINKKWITESPKQSLDMNLSHCKLSIAKKLINLANGNCDALYEGTHGCTYAFSIKVGMEKIKHDPKSNSLLSVIDTGYNSLLMTYDTEYGITMAEQANSFDVPMSLALSIKQASRNLKYQQSSPKTFDTIIIDFSHDAESLQGFVFEIRDSQYYQNTPIILLTHSDQNLDYLRPLLQNIFIAKRPGYFPILYDQLNKIMTTNAQSS